MSELWTSHNFRARHPVQATMHRLRWPLAALCLVANCSGQTGSPAVPSTTGPSSTSQGCAVTSVGLTPLSQPGANSYQGLPLGLYPGGTNQIPSSHLSAGLDVASSIGPLTSSGVPNPSGRFGLISVGMSNTTQEFQAFMALSPSTNPKLTIVDGAQGGVTASDWADPGCPCWNTLDDRIRQAGLSNNQVVAAWIKLANRQPTGEWPVATVQLKNDTVTVIRALASRLPNLRLAYLSSRIYAGYATTTQNPEPYAYQSGFAVRSVIEDQLSGQLPFAGASRAAPWLAWGPYLWADGMTPRSDGLTWGCNEFASDGTHPGPLAEQKIAGRLADFFRTEPTARRWFTGS